MQTCSHQPCPLTGEGSWRRYALNSYKISIHSAQLSPRRHRRSFRSPFNLKIPSEIMNRPASTRLVSSKQLDDLVPFRKIASVEARCE